MPVVLGIDLGTTKITCIAIDVSSGQLLAVASGTNEANVTASAERALGYSEWQPDQIVTVANRCLASVTQQLGSHAQHVVGIGTTGQQHGTLLVDTNSGQPISPLINWQDRRALQITPDGKSTWLQAARDAIGANAWKQTGCWLQPGFMAVTLFERNRRDELPANARSLFIMDYFVARLTGHSPVTEPSCAGSSGAFNVCSRDWDESAITALGLPRSLFPEVREADVVVGGLTNEVAKLTGLPAGIPVFPPIGDHQASFVGSVADHRNSVLVNVGTGAQVAVYTEEFEFAPPIELRPCPLGGNLLSNVGLAGGWSYQVLEQFFHCVGRDIFQRDSDQRLYDVMNRLASEVAIGSDGLRCDPLFSGTRLDPTVRGSISGLSPRNFTPGHLARSVLEGMGRSLYQGFQDIQQVVRCQPTRLVAAGNGLRKNPLLAEIVSDAFGLRMSFTKHREEAAFGAAVVASVGAKLFPNLEQAAQSLIHADAQ